LTTFDLDEYVYEALRAGASGFVLKDDPPEQLLAAIRTVARGDALLSPAITKRVISQFTRIPRPTPPKELEQLTAREQEILRLIAGGRSSTSARRPSRPTSRTSSRSSASATACRQSCWPTRPDSSRDPQLRNSGTASVSTRTALRSRPFEALGAGE
jgi:hypothetical protein